MANASGLTRGPVFLTHRAIENMRPSQQPYRVTDQRCAGLAVRVAPSGLKTWDLAYRIRGSDKTKRLSLGRTADVSLDAARGRANALTTAARAGQDLLAAEEQSRIAAAARITVAQLIDLYIRRRVAGRLRTAKEIESRLKRALSSVDTRASMDLRRSDMRELFDKCADSGLEREAEKRRQIVGAMFKWALAQDIVQINPVAGLSAYNSGTPRDRVLNWPELATLWRWLSSGAMPPSPSEILKLQLLTGARCGEVGGMSVEEIDQETWTWVLPADRSKNKRARVTPLVGLAREIVGGRLACVVSGPLFKSETGTKLTAAHVGHYLLARRRKLPVDPFTTHDLRRTVATMLVETGVSLEWVSAVIGHDGGGKEARTLLRHYVRTNQLAMKQNVLSRWDERLRVILGQPVERARYPATPDARGG